jgi:hypothetical protein
MLHSYLAPAVMMTLWIVFQEVLQHSQINTSDKMQYLQQWNDMQFPQTKDYELLF